MSEQLHGQIDTKQQEIETLKGPAEAKKKIREHRATYVGAVDSGQRELKTAAGKLKSPEAQAFLTKASGEISGHLTSMATRGRDIIKAHEDAKEGEEPGKVPSMDDLSGKLKNQLGGLKKSIDSFKVLEELEMKDIKKIEDANETLNSSPGKTDPLEIFSSKDKLLKDLNRLTPKFTSTGASRSYAKKIGDTFRALAKKIADEKTELSLGPTARYISAQDFLKAVTTYESLIKAAEANPSIDTLRAVEAQAKLIDPAKAHTDIFGERDKGTFTYVESMYTYLQTEYDGAKKKFDGLKERFDNAEKEALTKAAEKMMADVEAVEKETVAPLWDQYEPLSRRTDLAGKELEAYEQKEKGLISAYLTLKMTMAPFAKQETQFKLQGEVYKQVQAKIAAVDGRIRQIEVNRQTRKSMDSLGKVGANVFSYVTFLGEEKDGKIYTFNAAYDALSDEKKQEVRMAVESIVARDKIAVKSETQKAMVALSKSTGNFDRISDVLGEKSKKYAEGLKLLASGKHAEATAAFEAYVGQSFSEEERTLNAAAITDAQERISLMKYSGDFYEGLNEYGKGDVNAAAKKLNAYVAWAEKSGNAELHKEQISQAREILHLIGLNKVQQLDTLLADVKLWKKKNLQDQYGSGGQKIDFKIKGPEVDIIVNGIEALKKKVQKGELIDYDEEFSKLKSRVHLYLQKNAIDPKNNVIDKFSELYEGINSSDPKVRKSTCLKFAKELRNLRGYDKAREYLDKALQEDYRKAAQEVSQEKVMKTMLGNKIIMTNVRNAASAYLERFKKENPDIPEAQLRQQAEQIVFNMWLKKRYSRELRHYMSSQPKFSTDEALRLHNEWTPYKDDREVKVLKPSTWENYDEYSAEEWDEFKDSAKQNIALTLATLPIGFGAGAVGAHIGKVAFRSIATRLLVRTGAVGAEVAITTIEQGGIQALKFGSQAWKALTPQMQRAVIYSRLGAGAISVGVEGTLLLGGSTVAEGLITGRSTPITSANLVESIFKAMAFRGIGMGGHKLFGKALEAGGKRGTAALLAMESLSGIAGTGVEAASLYMHGHGEHVNARFVLRSLLENALTSTGMHMAHTRFARGKSRKNTVEEAHSKQVVDDFQKNAGVDFKKTSTIKSARITPEGVFINGKPAPHFTREVLASLPKKTRQHIELLAATPKRPKTRPSADIPGLKKKLANMDLPAETRKQLERTIAKFERAEMNARELDAAIHTSFNESRKIQIPDPDHPEKLIDVDLHSDFKTKNFAYSPRMTKYLNDYAQLKADGPIIVKHGGDEIVILHAGPDGKTQMFFGDVGNMGPSNEFSLRVEGGSANLVDLYLRDLAGVIKAEFKPGQKVDGPRVLGRIKNELAQKYFGIKTEAGFNALKEKWNLEGDWPTYQKKIKNARILAGFRSDARSLQSEFLKKYPGAESSLDASRDNAAFAKFVGEKVAGLDSGSPPLTQILRDNLDAFKNSEALNDLLPKGLDADNKGSLTLDRLKSILSKKHRSAEEELVLYYALRRVNSKSLPKIPGLDTAALGKRFSKIRQPDSAATLMDFQMAGVDVPTFKGRPVNHTDMKFFLDKVLEDALHAAKEKKGSLDIEKVKSPFDAEGRIPASDTEMAKAYGKASKDAKPKEVQAFLDATAKANVKLQEIQQHIQQMSSKEKPTQADIAKLQRLKSEYDVHVAEINKRKFSDPETGADRGAKFNQDAESWLRDMNGEEIPENHRMLREFTLDINNAGAINAQRGYAVLDASMSALAQQLRQQFPGISSIVRTGGGEFRIMFLDQSKLPKINGEPMTLKQQKAHIAAKLPKINAAVQAVIQPNGKTYVDGVVRDATSQFRSKPGSEGGVGQLTLKDTHEVPQPIFRHALDTLGKPRSLYKIREHRQTGSDKPVEKQESPSPKKEAA